MCNLLGLICCMNCGGKEYTWQTHNWLRELKVILQASSPAVLLHRNSAEEMTVLLLERPCMLLLEEDLVCCLQSVPSNSSACAS